VEVFIMNENILKWGGIGVLAILAAVAAVLFFQRGSHLDMPGQVLKVRTANITDNLGIAVIDYRVTDQSDYPAEIGGVSVYMEDKSGNRIDGKTVSDPDAKRVFDALPVLGQKYNKSLVIQEKMPPHATWDRMVAATFDAPAATLDQRKRFVVAIQEVDTGVFEIKENPAAK
jgi:hypothetical protein